MTDVVSKEARSRMMAGIRSRGTQPERLVRSSLHRRGFRFSSKLKLPGRPDVILPRWRVAIFVHGCFWHVHGCRLSKMPSTNVDFWQKKLEGNFDRDERVVGELLTRGWRVAVLWECALRSHVNSRTLHHAMDRLENWIKFSEDSWAFELNIADQS